ncbi:hypothetical protein [Streptomonospora wellingtoniae]|uniref:Uncharacterized protein n=1 Tax=Streptomonospora wellingtoniae TaxID=3075544 RepID=A0ABU2KN70_9ACTN|nr:hypothetical protein [Streptomonospora sp. DSM 45055]MDT0300719.1 hypothetical protein [Streptomonospora sp. DSM 45055]
MSTRDTDDVLLAMLKARYGAQWSIRRTENLWLATANDPETDHAPTIVQPDVEAFVRELEDPPARAGRPSLLSSSWVAAQFDQAGEGAYVSRESPRP